MTQVKEKKIKTKGFTQDGREYWTFEDGSVAVKCVRCWGEGVDRIETLPVEHWFARKMQTAEGSAKDYICLNHWQKGKDAQKDADKDQRREEIIIGQATNMALQKVLKNNLDYITPDNKENPDAFMKNMDFWFEKFYNFLVEKQNKQNKQ